MKQRRFIDPQTRVLSFTLPVRANHAKVVTRLTIMLQLTSLGNPKPKPNPNPYLNANPNPSPNPDPTLALALTLP